MELLASQQCKDLADIEVAGTRLDSYAVQRTHVYAETNCGGGTFEQQSFASIDECAEAQNRQTEAFASPCERVGSGNTENDLLACSLSIAVGTGTCSR